MTLRHFPGWKTEYDHFKWPWNWCISGSRLYWQRATWGNWNVLQLFLEDVLLRCVLGWLNEMLSYLNSLLITAISCGSTGFTTLLRVSPFASVMVGIWYPLWTCWKSITYISHHPTSLQISPDLNIQPTQHIYKILFLLLHGGSLYKITLWGDLITVVLFRLNWIKIKNWKKDLLVLYCTISV